MIWILYSELNVILIVSIVRVGSLKSTYFENFKILNIDLDKSFNLEGLNI